MNIYQIIYNSSASTLNGSSGFGVRTVSEGTPQEYIDAINNTSALRSYNSGKFNIPSNVILTSPEKIYEYPKGYYYRIIQIKSKKVYVIARIVSTCFDHSFYVTGKATRPGNYVAHIFMFDDFPGKKAFNLFADTTNDAEIHFIPRDWTPIMGNKELTELMVGKPQYHMPALSGEFPVFPLTWDCKSLDLLFSYRAALKEDKPILVSLKDTITASTVSKFVSLLPLKLAEETTFVINHQAEGTAKDVRISFINEYYQHTIYPNLCTHIDLLDDSRVADKFEGIWRSILEQALNSNDKSKVDLLTDWIFSNIADENTDSTTALNEALFNYCKNPSKFPLSTIDEVDNILEIISKYVKDGYITAEHLNFLLIQATKDASGLKDFARAINYCKIINKAGLDISSAKRFIQNKFSDFITGDIILFYNAFLLLKDVTLREFSVAGRYPAFNDMLPVILSKQSDILNIITFAKFLENNANIRVKNYVSLLNKYPEFVSEFSLLLDSDKAVAEKVDYITSLISHLGNPAFAKLFYQQIKMESNTNAPFELINKIYNLTKVNHEFKQLILKDEQIYCTIHSRTKRAVNNGNYLQVSKLIDTNIFPLLPLHSIARKQWQLLYDVLNLKLPDKKTILPFYNTAKEISHLDALKMVTPLCFEVLDVEQIDDFLSLVKQHCLMTDSDVIRHAFSDKSKHHLSYILAVARMYEYDYDKLYNLISKCVKNDKETKKLIKANVPALYSSHKKDAFFAGIKSLFCKNKTN